MNRNFFMQKKLSLVIILFGIAHNVYGLERHVGTLTRAQLRGQQVEDAKKPYFGFMARNGVNTILQYTPMFAVGTGIFLDALYLLYNLKDKCGMQPLQTMTAQECDLWKQLGMGFVICECAAGCIGNGCQNVLDSGICRAEQCCSESCTLCTQECCSLLGMSRYKAHDE